MVRVRCAFASESCGLSSGCGSGFVALLLCVLLGFGFADFGDFIDYPFSWE
jgi:hypothetical protein